MGFQAEAQKIMALRAIAKENVRAASVCNNERMDAFEKNRVSEGREKREPNRTIDSVHVLCNLCARIVRVERVVRVF